MHSSDSGGGSSSFEVIIAAEESDLPTRIGEYQIERLIGSGGMGRVYLATHGPMERKVALKVLPAERMDNPKSLKRFYSEVRAAARVMHPNIVTAFDAGKVAGIHFLAMEYVDGLTISQLVTRDGPFAVGDAVENLRQAALGLQQVHRSGIVHRDIKPANIMLTLDRVIKVLDLGLASVGRDVRDSIEPNRLVGTVEYMSPEQLESAADADARADIYSLGVTFFFMLTGSTPFQGGTLEQVRSHRHETVPDLCMLRSDVDVRIDHMFQRMMAKRPFDRYATVSELLEDIDRWRTLSGGQGYALAGATRVVSENPTAAGLETTSSPASTEVLGIDLGMFYGTAARANPAGDVEALFAGGRNKPLLRLAIHSQSDQVQVGDTAIAVRLQNPERVTHCLPLYLGQAIVERRVAGTCCSPEVLLAMLIRKISYNAWHHKQSPLAAAVTVPACYDQLHRRAILQACQIAGLPEVRLVDRSVAAAQAALMDDWSPLGPDACAESPQHQLVVCVLGNSTEVVLLRRVSGRLQQLAVSGQLHTGTLTWQQKLVDLAAEQCKEKYGIEPRRSLRDAAQLQVACERALSHFLLNNQATLEFIAGGQPRRLTLHREALFAECRQWLDEFERRIDDVLSGSANGGNAIQSCLTVGVIAKLPPLRRVLRRYLGERVPLRSLERLDLAKGAALAVAGELPGRDGIPLPPQACTPHDLGILVRTPGKNGKTSKKILPVVPRGTVLPARTHRRLNMQGDDETLSRTLTLVESRNSVEGSWRTLGTQRVPESSSLDSRVELSFKVDVNGLLTISVRDPATGQTDWLPVLPKPTLTEIEVRRWRDWLDDLDASRSGIFRRP